MNHTVRWAAFAGIFLFITSAHAGLNAWTAAGPEGGFTTVVAHNPQQPAMVIAATYGGVYRSVNGGTSWARVDAPQGAIPRNFTFDPSDVNRVFAANGNLLGSDNNGQSFSPVPGARQPPDPGVNEVWFNRDGSYLFALTYSAKIFRSATLGASWTEVTGTWPLNPPSSPTLAVDPNDANILYVAVLGSGIYKTVNAGTSWAATGVGPGNNTTYLVNQIAIKPGDGSRIAVSVNDGVYVSANGGTTWSHPYPYGNYSVAFDPTTPQNVIIVPYDGNLLRSTNSGDTFPIAGAVLRNYYQLRGLHFVAGVPNKLFVACADGPLLSTDAGVSFAPAVSGIRAESLGSLSASDDGAVYAAFSGGPGGVFKRSNTGWQPVNNAALYIAGVSSLGYNNPRMSTVAVAPQNGNLLYAVFAHDSIVKSTDGGASWMYAGSPLLGGNRQLRQVAIDPSNASVAYVPSATDGVWKTIDGGLNWLKQSSGLPNNVNAVTIDRANPQVVYASTFLSGTTTVFKTTNGGASWSPTGATPAGAAQGVAVDPSDANVVYAAVPLALQKSTNAGTSWTSILSARPSRSISIDAAVPGTLISGLSGSPGGFSRSVDGGAIWEHFDWPATLSNGNVADIIAVDPSRPSRVMSGGFGTGILEYEVAPDLQVVYMGPTVPMLMDSSFNATFSVRNLGPAASSAAELRVTLPAWLTPTPPAGCTFATLTISCQLQALRVSDPARDIVIPLKAAANPASGSIEIQLNTHETDVAPGNNAAIIPLVSIAQSDLGVAIVGGNRTVTVSDAVNFTVTASNVGPTRAPNTRVLLQIPANVTVQTVTSSAGTCATSGAMVTCGNSTLDNGASVTIVFTGTAATAGSAVFTAEVHGDTLDTIGANNTISTTFTINAAPAPAPAPTPSPAPGGGGGKGGGGGSLDWLALLLLGELARRRLGAGLPRGFPVR